MSTMPAADGRWTLLRYDVSPTAGQAEPRLLRGGRRRRAGIAVDQALARPDDREVDRHHAQGRPAIGIHGDAGEGGGVEVAGLREVLAETRPTSVLEVGSASCGERVCQSGYIWGCAVSLKKK